MADVPPRRRRETSDSLPDYERPFRVPEPAKIIPPVNSHLQISLSESTPLLAPHIPCTVEEHMERGLSGRNTVSVVWEEAKILTKYALPIFVTYSLEHSILMSSVIAIGHISTTALAAVTLGFMTANVSGLSIILGMTNTLDTILPSAWTSDQPQLVGLWTQRMVILQFIILIPIYAIWLSGEALLLALRQDPEVARYAGTYLKWASFGLPAFSFNCISRRYFHAQGLFDVPARIIICVAPINILMNYALVWGPDSIRLGFIGAPIAISISYNLISIASVIYGVFFVEKSAWHPISTRCLTSLGPLAWLCLGSIGQFASDWWAWELVGLAASFLGPVSLATQSILLTTTSCAFQAPYALGIATAVRIGNLLGEKKSTRAGVAANTSLLLAFTLALLLSGFLLVFRKTWGYLFNSDPEVVALVAAVLPLVALVHICDDCGPVISGILRVQGKQSLGAMINISAYYFLGLPSWALADLQASVGSLWPLVGSQLCVGVRCSVWHISLSVDRLAKGSGKCDGSLGG
ncbi:multidrug Oligosaccharidyl-lipid polysaccharide flippase [Boletus coccyginus]|nr:multidrug Oligosaccharidyl-lipid polysaccharide flippase [Boletus coccyginus]